MDVMIQLYTSSLLVAQLHGRVYMEFAVHWREKSCIQTKQALNLGHY